MTTPSTERDYSLGKWPRLLVTGDRITEEQANDILVRTNEWATYVNDREWLAIMCGFTGLMPNEAGTFDLTSLREFETAHNVLRLNMLANHQIASAWIGGPHGWCHWDGTIGAANYNLGKWPQVDHVTEEWNTIAAAFPYLTLRAQLLPEDPALPFDQPGWLPSPVEWRIDQGRVEVIDDPESRLRAPEDEDPENMVVRMMFDLNRERGVDVSRLSAALRQVRHIASSGSSRPADEGGERTTWR